MRPSKIVELLDSSGRDSIGHKIESFPLPIMYGMKLQLPRKS